MAQRIYDGEKITFDRDLLHETAKTYMDAVQKGYGKSLPDVAWNSPDFKTLEKLTENVFKFSASKNYNTLRDMSLLLKDGDHIRTFDDFQKEVDKLNVKYNHNWLRTEYNQAVASSQCAARWTDYGRRADKNPFLQYQAVMDANTRAEHAALNGVVKRYDDEFWDKYYPPNGWGCRCEVIQLPGKNHKETPAADIKYCNVPAAFKVNVGKTGKIFSEEHPYFMQRCKNCRTQLYVKGNPQCEACLNGQSRATEYIQECIKERDAIKYQEKRDKAKQDLYNWGDNLPVVNGGHRLVVNIGGDKIIINKGFISETISKNGKLEQLKDIYKVLQSINQWLPTATKGKPEQGKHHKETFDVYTADFGNKTITVKVINKVSGDYAYVMWVNNKKKTH